jgi:hypothetical protein
VLLIFCGTSVALTALPGWMAAVGRWPPLTQGIEAESRRRATLHTP